MQDLPIRKGSLRFILSIRPALFLLIGLSLAALFLTIVVIGIIENRRNVRRMMENEARALVESIILTSKNTIAATDMVDNLVLDNLGDVASLVGQQFEQGELTSVNIARVCLATGINRMDVLDIDGTVAVSSIVELIGQSYDVDFTSQFPFEELLLGQVKSASFVLDDENPVIPPQLVLATSRIDAPGAVILFADYSILERFGNQIGIGALIRQIGSEIGVEYVFLQSDQGVILSSRSLGKVLKIESDPFLQEIQAGGGYGSREIDFEGRKVLEVVRAFSVQGLPEGVLRVGLSMAGFDQVTGNFEVQLTAIGLILFIASFLIVTLFLANLNYRALESSFVKMKTVTDNILDSMQSAVVVTDDTGVITQFNPRAEQIFGMRLTDVLRRKYDDVFSSDELLLRKLESSPTHMLRSEEAVSLVDGRDLILLIAASVVTGEQGSIIGSVAVAYDVTEERKLESSAKRSERLSELGNLAAGVAHEIRNPLNAISIASQRLKSEFEPKSDEVEYGQLVGNIKSEITRLNDIINQFLALARTSSASREPFDLSELCEEVRRLLEAEADALGMKLNAASKPGMIVNGSREEIKKVIINLLKNSIEACGKGDRINVSVVPVSDKEVTVVIEDNGPGIADENLERIFRPYFTTKENGTGLGLALSYRIVSDHDGTIEYMNRKDGGARFIITFPLLKEVR